MKYHIDNIPFNSGKYSSSTAYQIAKIDPNYIIQAYHLTPKFPITEGLYRECLNDYFYHNDPDHCVNCD